MERDLLWYRAWFRYAWNPYRDQETENLYWEREFAGWIAENMPGSLEMHSFSEGTFSPEKRRMPVSQALSAGREPKDVSPKENRDIRRAAKLLLNAFEAAGECAPRILRRIGITDGNRQTFSLGMTMSQLTNVRRYRPNTELWKSASTPGEQPEEFIQKELKGEPHLGETPADMIRETDHYSGYALKCAMKALVYAGLLKKKRDSEQDAVKSDKSVRQDYDHALLLKEALSLPPCGLARAYTDILAIYFLTNSYNRKLEAALNILRYRFSMDEGLRGDLELLKAAVKPWQESLEWYRLLTSLTEKTYLYANSMQTRQRKIPFPDGNRYSHWKECLPEYEKEYAAFVSHLEQMEDGHFPETETKEGGRRDVLCQAGFLLDSPDCEIYRLKKGENLFTDMESPVRQMAGELDGLTAVRFSLDKAIREGITLKLSFEEDVFVLIGYIQAKGVEWLQLPELETNTHAFDRGGQHALIRNALLADGIPGVNVHALRYEKGEHVIYLGTGGFAFLGVAAADSVTGERDAGLTGESPDKLDWLYEQAFLPAVENRS